MVLMTLLPSLSALLAALILETISLHVFMASRPSGVGVLATQVRGVGGEGQVPQPTCYWQLGNLTSITQVWESGISLNLVPHSLG